jgi:fructokinase
MTALTAQTVWVLGESLMDCIAQADGTLKPLMGGSPYNMARAAALRGAQVAYLNPLSTDRFGDQLAAQLQRDGVAILHQRSRLPTSLAVVQLTNGQPSYGFYREGVADRDYSVDAIVAQLKTVAPGVLHTGSLNLVPPESDKVLAIVQQARALGWTISVDVNLRPMLAADVAQYVQAVLAVAAQADWLKASDEDLVSLGLGVPGLQQAAHAAAHFTRRGASRVAITWGGDGAYLQVGAQSATRSAPIVQVVDTVGAGDTFWGNCLADWVASPHNADARVDDTLQKAMLAAAINCTRAACQPPPYSELVNWL